MTSDMTLPERLDAAEHFLHQAQRTYSAGSLEQTAALIQQAEQECAEIRAALAKGATG